MQPYYRKRGASVGPGAAEYYAGCLSLPMFPRMTNEDTARVIAEISQAATDSKSI